MKTNPGRTAAIAVNAMLMSLLLSASPTSAKVIYTPVNVTVRGDTPIPLDLNHDGNPDFVLKSTSHVQNCGLRDGLTGSTTISPAFGNGVVVSQSNYAAILPNGFPVDSNQLFYLGVATVLQFSCLIGGTKIVSGYLGLEGHANGQTRYGWARVKIVVVFRGRNDYSMTTTVFDAAFETIPGKSILTGQTSDSIDDARNIPESIQPVDHDSGSPVSAILVLPTARTEREKWGVAKKSEEVDANLQT